MEHATIRASLADDFIFKLNKLTEGGYRVISAGAIFNENYRALEWWAILQKDDEAQQEPEEPKDEAAELLEAARKISDICAERQGCGECPFYRVGCRFAKGFPHHWDIRGVRR